MTNRITHIHAAAAAFCVAGLALSASAQLSPIAPFTGEYSEPFTSGSGFPECVAAPVFGGQATLCTFDQNGSPVGGAHITTGWGFECTILPHSPPVLYGSANGISEYNFLVPVGRFGGYFGANNNSVALGGTATFYDAANVEIGQMPIVFNPCGQWNWNGWESSVPFVRVKLASGVFGGAFVMMDSMEFDAFGGGPCYANCDGSTTPPILNVEDFTCFINEFAAAQGLPAGQQITHYANCDQSTTAPVLNVEDFTCFINKFAQGCP
jgi:hypothetical protein